jgi:hypothetical protein
LITSPDDQMGESDIILPWAVGVSEIIVSYWPKMCSYTEENVYFDGDNEIGTDSNTLSHLSLNNRIPNRGYLPALQTLLITSEHGLDTRGLQQLCCPNLRSLQISYFSGACSILRAVLKALPLLENLAIFGMDQNNFLRNGNSFTDDIKLDEYLHIKQAVLPVRWCSKHEDGPQIGAMLESFPNLTSLGLLFSHQWGTSSFGDLKWSPSSLRVAAKIQSISLHCQCNYLCLDRRDFDDISILHYFSHINRLEFTTLRIGSERRGLPLEILTEILSTDRTSIEQLYFPHLDHLDFHDTPIELRIFHRLLNYLEYMYGQSDDCDQMSSNSGKSPNSTVSQLRLSVYNCELRGYSYLIRIPDVESFSTYDAMKYLESQISRIELLSGGV